MEVRQSTANLRNLKRGEVSRRTVGARIAYVPNKASRVGVVVQVVDPSSVTTPRTDELRLRLRPESQ